MNKTILGLMVVPLVLSGLMCAEKTGGFNLVN